MRLLHLEDTVNDADLIATVIHATWPNCKIKRVERRAEFLAELSPGDFDIVLSDYTLPDFDGLSALELIRRHHPRKPFIFLSGTIGEERAIEALKLGAFDYVVKDRPARLVSSIQHALAKVKEEDKLRKTEARIREQAELLDQARDAICVITPERLITYWNASAERLYGWSAAEAIGKDFRALLFPDKPVAVDKAMDRALSKEDWLGELSPRTRSGASLIVESRWTLVPGREGNPNSILLINTDITERKKIEALLLRSQRLESIGALTSGIAHDLNNIFTPIVMAASVLKNLPVDSEDRKFIDAIVTAGQHGSDLIKQLLNFARGAQGEHTRLHLDQLITDTVRLLRPTLNRSIYMDVRTQNDVWP
ncbi:MAG TPA: PAS domain S-box protein, partial [Opitutaceae bacterium]|nr:PAS domain S-box protein [Opitutaceae bacterium]